MSPGEQIDLMHKQAQAEEECGLSIRPRIIKHLAVGESAIIGPYKHSKGCGTTICRVREQNPEMDFEQKKFILVDPVTCESFPVYLVTRVEARAGE